MWEQRFVMDRYLWENGSDMLILAKYNKWVLKLNGEKIKTFDTKQEAFEYIKNNYEYKELGEYVL